MKTALVVLGLSPTGLYVVREAGRNGYEVYGFSDQSECGASSRYLVNRGSDTVIQDYDRLLAEIVGLSRKYDQVGVIPTTDRHVEFLLERGAELPKTVRVAEAYRSTAAVTALDKAATYALASAVGVATPRTFNLVNDLPLSSAAVFPLILKPRSIHKQRHWLKGRKLFLCNNQDEYQAVVEQEFFQLEEWTAQSLISGPESNIHVAAVFRDASGSCQVFTGQKLRQFPVNFGSASLLISHADREVETAAIALLNKMDFQGIAGVEFKREARDGQLYLVEINARPSLWFAAATAAGVKLVAAQCRDWWGGESQPQADGDQGAQGVVWRYGLKDFLAVLLHRNSKNDPLLPAPAPHIDTEMKQIWAVYDWQDWRPAVAELGVYFKKLLRRVFA